MGCFSIFKEERKVISKNISFLRPVLGRYQIEDSDITLFKKIYSENFFVPDLLKLAVDSFELSYEAPNSKMKFVLLMMGLESIFNKSSQDPISHILSRHIALLLGKTKPEFEELFQTVKKLYKTRCDIVHGSTERKTLLKLEKNIQNELNQLESLTRMVISELLWLNDSGNSGLNKESLFEYLNKKGFEG
jgi:hypothetical protein